VIADAEGARLECSVKYPKSSPKGTNWQQVLSSLVKPRFSRVRDQSVTDELYCYSNVAGFLLPQLPFRSHRSRKPGCNRISVRGDVALSPISALRADNDKGVDAAISQSKI